MSYQTRLPILWLAATQVSTLLRLKNLPNHIPRGKS
jgi:hypothetical protein